MKIISNILIIVFIFFILMISPIYAVDSESLVLEENVADEIVLNNQSNSSTINPTPTVTYTSSTPDNTLSISDIIDIILIAVCIVLIFLAIAILIRCK